MATDQPDHRPEDEDPITERDVPSGEKSDDGQEDDIEVEWIDNEIDEQMQTDSELFGQQPDTDPSFPDINVVPPGMSHTELDISLPAEEQAPSAQNENQQPDTFNIDPDDVLNPADEWDDNLFGSGPKSALGPVSGVYRPEPPSAKSPSVGEDDSKTDTNLPEPSDSKEPVPHNFDSDDFSDDDGIDFTSLDAAGSHLFAERGTRGDEPSGIYSKSDPDMLLSPLNPLSGVNPAPPSSIYTDEMPKLESDSVDHGPPAIRPPSWGEHTEAFDMPTLDTGSGTSDIFSREENTQEFSKIIPADSQKSSEPARPRGRDLRSKTDSNLPLPDFDLDREVNKAANGSGSDSEPGGSDVMLNPPDSMAGAANRGPMAMVKSPSSLETKDPTGPTMEVARLDDETAGKRGSGWLVGTAAGLLIGVGGAAGAYFGGLIPPLEQQTPQQVAQTPTPPASTPAAPVANPEDAQAWLAAGNPAKALAIFNELDQLTPEQQVAKGQARWLARLQELAVTGEPIVNDDAEFQAASDEFASLLEQADGANPAAVSAALNLGLIREVTGDTTAAREIYTGAADKFPAAKELFDTALLRLDILATQAEPGQGAQLLPGQAFELARFNLMTVIFLQDPLEEPEPTAMANLPEAGVPFWKAVNAAQSGDYDQALKSLAEARKRHDARRLANLSRGLNPTSDPLEQIFLRACDDLQSAWKLRQELYGHPKFGDQLAEAGAGKTLDGLATQLDDYAVNIKKLETARTTLDKELKAVTLMATEANTKLKDLEEKYTKLDDDNDKAKKELAESMKKLTEVTGQLKTADTLLAVVVAELKDSEFLNKDDEVSKVLPKVIKDVATAATSADAKRNAEALKKANAQVESTLQDLAVAKKEAAKAMELAKTAMADTDKKVKAAQAEEQKKTELITKKLAETEKAMQAKIKEEQTQRAEMLAKLKKEMDAELAKLSRELQQAEANTAAQLAEQAEQYEKLITDAREGVRVPMSAAQNANRLRANRLFGEGISLYLDRKPEAAIDFFTEAIEIEPNDARYWYFLGLGHLGIGNQEEAEESFRKGADLEVRGRPAVSTISASLERVQGRARQVLSAYRP